MSQPSTLQSINKKGNQKNPTNKRETLGKSTVELSTKLRNFHKTMAKSVSEFARNSREPEDPEYNVFENILNANATAIIDVEDEEMNEVDRDEQGTTSSKGNENDSGPLNRKVKKEPTSSSSTSNLTISGSISLETQPTCSSSLATPPVAEQIENTFISRIRKAHHSQLIDMSMNYELRGLRYFQDIQGMDVCLDGYQPVELNVVTFNVLCQSSLEQTRHLYRHLYGRRVSNLNWEFRKPKLQIELDRLSGDVYCLQEIQDCHFEQFFKPYFLQRGYEGQYKRRTGNPPDGCAIFWRPHRLELLNSRSIAYNLGVQGMNRDNVGQICVFGIRGFGTAICVSNTHIHFNMKKGEVKLAQIAYLLASMDQMEKEFLAESSESTHNYVHFAGHILCGDFNMYPGSPLHRFLLDRQICLRTNKDYLAVSMEMATQKQQQTLMAYMPILPPPISLPLTRMAIFWGNCTFVDGDGLDSKCTELCHNFKFASVYEHWNIIGEPELSSYHIDPIQPDYIFYTVSGSRKDQLKEQRKNANGNNANMAVDAADLANENFIQLWRRLSLPTKAQFDRAGGPLPNEEYGSDHLSLLACFRILCLPIVQSEIQLPSKNPQRKKDECSKKRKNGGGPENDYYFVVQ